MTSVGEASTGRLDAADRPLSHSAGGRLTDEGTATSLAEAFLDVCATAPGTFVFLDPDLAERRMGYADVLERAGSVLAGLRALGIEPGDPVPIALRRPDEIITTFWACQLGGFVPLILPEINDRSMDGHDIAKYLHVWRLLDRPLTVTDDALGPVLAEAQDIGDGATATFADLASHPRTDEYRLGGRDDRVLYVLTSGSTGMPKVIPHTNATLLDRARATNELSGHLPSDVCLVWLAFDHIGTISDWHLRCVLLGNDVVHARKEVLLADITLLLDLVDRYRITHTWAPNFAYALINEAVQSGSVAADWDLSCVTTLLSAGEAVLPSVVRRFHDLLAPNGLAPWAIKPAFGMAETGSGITYFVPGDHERDERVLLADRESLGGDVTIVDESHLDAVALSCLGPPIPGVEMRIVDELQSIVPAGRVGRLQVAGRAVFSGYHANPEVNAEVFTDDGWFDTGDLGFLHDGQLVITGRAKEVIIVNGANVSATEIEGVVESLEGIETSFTCACAVKDEAGAERLAVFFSPQADADEAGLLSRIRRSVTEQVGVAPSYLIPLDRSEIPKTPIGKIQRTQLAKRFSDGTYRPIVQRTDLVVGADRTVPAWFHRVDFVPQNVLPSGSRRFRHVVVTGRVTALSDEVVEALSTVAAPVDDLRSDGPAGASAVDEPIDLLVHVADRADAEPESPALDEIATRSARHLADLQAAGALLDTPGRDATRVLVVAGPGAADAALPGLLRSWQQEIPGVQATLVELDDERFEDPTVIVAEASTPVVEPVVRYEGTARSVQRIVAVDLVDREPHRDPTFRRDRAYVVTGGLGGVGFELVGWLVQQHDANVVVLGRSAIDGDEPSAASMRFSSLRRQSERVVYRSVDLASLDDVRAAIADATSELGVPLGGALHLAGSYGEHTVAEMTADDLSALLAAKAGGFTNLARVLGEAGGGLLVGFSSAATLTGGALIGGYAAANCVLEAIGAGITDPSIDVRCYAWTSWRGLGMSEGADYGDVLAEKGQFAIGAAAGLLSLGALLDRDVETCLVGLDETKPAIASRLNTARPAVEVACAVEAPAAAFHPDHRVAVDDRFGSSASIAVKGVETIPRTADGEVDLDEVARLVLGRAARVGPRTETERRLHAIWRKVLDDREFGVHDNFFELGGDSLLAIQLFTEIGDAFGADLPLATLFEAPTIADLAVVLGDDPVDDDHAPASAASSEWSPLVRVQAGDGSRPFFCVHGGGGNVLIFKDLVARLGPDQTFYGLQAVGVDGRREPLTSIDAMAELYLEHIRRAQPAGPYRLGGYSGGGLVAHRIAHLLRDQGEDVALLCLFDTYFPGLEFTRQLTWKDHLGFVRQDGLGYLRGRVAQRIERFRWKRHLRRETHGADVVPLGAREMVILTAFQRAGDAYRPARHPGRIDLFLATDRQRIHSHLPDDLGWGEWCDELRTVDVAGNHDTILLEPNVGGVADALRTLIART